MAYELTGKIKLLQETQTFGSGFQKREIVLTAVRKDGNALQYASKKLRSDLEIVLEALKKGDGDTIDSVSDDFKNNREVVLEAAKIYRYLPGGCFALEYASKDLRADREIVLEAVRTDGNALKYASKDLRSDRKIVIKAIKTQKTAQNKSNNQI